MKLLSFIFLIFVGSFIMQACKVNKLDNTAKVDENMELNKVSKLRLEQEVEDLPAKELDIDYAMPADCYSEEIANANQRDCGKTANYVCGCNGKTYLNECEARKAGIVNLTQGKCP